MNSTDFFEVLSTNNPFRALSIATFVALIVLILPLIYGIVWFEIHGSDKQRILSNKLVSSCCWTVIECGIFVQFPHIIRYIFGPLPQGLCFFLIIIQSAIVSDFLLLFDAMAITKYIIIYVLKNPSKLNNEFWHVFIVIWVKGFSFICQASWHICLSHQPMGFYICSGNNPLNESNPPAKIKGVIEIFSLLLHIYVYGRIRLCKTSSAIGPQTHNFFLKLLSLADIEELSVATFVVTIFNFLGLSMTPINMVFLNKLDPKLLVQYPYFICVYYIFLISPTLVTFFALLLYYCTYKPLQTTIKNEFFDSVLTTVCTTNNRNSSTQPTNH